MMASSELPEPLIHCIQSLLPSKQAARTTLVSKSWRSAWLTRPDLEFDEQDYSGTFEFLDVVSKCIKRYVQSNLKIQSFVLRMNHYADLAGNKFIVEALGIGATRIAIRMAYSSRNNDYDSLFASENLLVELSCTIRDKRESHVSIKGYIVEVSWLCAMNELLTVLSMSTKIYLSLDVIYNVSSFLDYDLEDMQVFPKPQVENVTIDNMTGVPALGCYALFDGLFRICIPNSITQYLVPKSSGCNWKTNNHFLCREFVHRTTGKRKVLCFYMFSLNDFKEASLHIWDEVDGEWHEMVPLESLIDAPSPQKKQKIQFRMGWK